MRKNILLLISILLMGSQASAWAQTAKAPINKWEEEIRKFEEADRQHPPTKNAILFLGSSSIKKWTEVGADFPKSKVLNRGFGGSQIPDSTYYVDRIVIPYQPKMIVFYAGDNDLAAGQTPQQVFEAYQAFVNRVRKNLPKTKIAFISIKPSPSRQALMQQMQATNQLIRDYSAKNKGLIYIDVFQPMLGSDGQPRPELFVQDRLHMNRQGYEIWKKVIAPYLD